LSSLIRSIISFLISKQ